MTASRNLIEQQAQFSWPFLLWTQFKIPGYFIECDAFVSCKYILIEQSTLISKAIISNPLKYLTFYEISCMFACRALSLLIWCTCFNRICVGCSKVLYEASYLLSKSDNSAWVVNSGLLCLLLRGTSTSVATLISMFKGVSQT